MEMTYYDAVVMAAWANDTQMQEQIAQQAIDEFKRTGKKITSVTLADNARLKLALRIFNDKVQRA